MLDFTDNRYLKELPHTLPSASLRLSVLATLCIV